MTEAVEQEVVWRGAEALRPFLVAIDSLQPFPGNPRRGDITVLRDSLSRFGQVRPLLVDAADPTLIVAGHHILLAAAEEGWTHVAAIPNEFADDDEARAYLLADNRTHDRGGYDLEALSVQLEALRDTSTLDGTGYTDGYLGELEGQLAALRSARNPTPPEEFPTLDPDTLVVEHRCPHCGYEWSGSPKPGAGAADDAGGDG